MQKNLLAGQSAVDRSDNQPVKAVWPLFEDNFITNIATLQ